MPAVCTDMAGLPKAFEPETFDLLTAFQVIEHVPDADEMIASCHKLLKPGGWIVITTPMVDSLQSQIFGAAGPRLRRRRDTCRCRPRRG